MKETKRIWLCALALVLTLITRSRATWELLGVPGAVGYADVIVVGKVTQIERPADSPFAIGTIDISEVIYGSLTTTKLRLIVDCHDHGLVYAVGDSGTFFLRIEQSGDPQGSTKQAAQRAPEEVNEFANSTFTASHPDTFWPTNEEFFERNKIKKLDEKQLMARRRELFVAVRKRLEEDIKRLSRALEGAQENLKRVNEQTDPTKSKN